jgi:hypothetical protein
MRYLLWLCLVFVALPVVAQEEIPSWCPVRDPVVGDVVASPQPQLVDVEFVDFGTIVTGQLSSDETLIAYTRLLHDVPVELWVANADGTNPRVLLYIEDLVNMREDGPHLVPGIHRYQWIPDTHQLLVNTGQFPISEEGIFEFVADDLWLINAETAEPNVLLAQEQGGEFILSPEGQFVIVQRRDQLLLIDSDGENLRTNVLPGYTAPGFGHAPYFPPIVWQDAESFLALTTTDPYAQADAEVTIWRVSRNGEAEALKMITAAFISVAFSPDGVFVAYWNKPTEQTNTRRLYITQTYGDEEFLFLESLLIEFAGWQPDARHFGYFDGIEASMTIGDVCGGIDPAPHETDTP